MAKKPQASQETKDWFASFEACWNVPVSERGPHWLSNIKRVVEKLNYHLLIDLETYEQETANAMADDGL